MQRPVPDELLELLADTSKGLSGAEVDARRARYGPNDILGEPDSGWRELLRDTLKDPMLWFLLGTSLLYGVLGDTREAVILLIALVPFLGMDAYLHRRTQASTAGLSKQLASRVAVLRGGERVVVPTADLVPGDLIELSASDFAPADAILCTDDGLQVDESALTGEAYPVRKHAFSTSAGRQGGDREANAWVLAGTRVLTGAGRLRIAYTGADTFYGEIVRSAQRGRQARTPLQKAIGQLVAILVVAATLLCIALAMIRWHQGHGLLDALLSAVTLAVAALPEEFPIVFTFFLGVGVYRLARRRALVRRAVVVENIGRVTTICSDKTGTLTEGRLALSQEIPADEVEADGLLSIAAAASDPEGTDPIDAAILARATAPTSPIVARFPFTEDRKRETRVFERSPGMFLAVAKGAPETVVDMSALDDDQRRSWLARVEALAAKGYKVIACASLTIDAADWQGQEPDEAYDIAGLLAFEDPVRDGVREAVADCRRSGIHVIMVTGDHPLTATAIGRQIGLADGKPKVVLADDIQATIESDPAALRRIDVIARAIPSQKLAIVQALQALDEIVAVTGDGVNDVPALKAADVGIAMGQRGTQSAREVASIVLTDDNFSSIVHAIGEGQQLFSNLRLSFAYLLMIHLPLVLSAALIPLAGYPLLYLPIHIVWLELIIHPTALLVFQNLPGDRLLARGRGQRRIRFFRPSEWATIGAVGLLLTVLLIAGYDRSLGADQAVEHARATVIVALSIASAALMAVLSGLRTPTAWAVAIGTLVGTMVLVQTPFLASKLHVMPLHLDDWLIALAAGSLIALLPMLGSMAHRRSD